jgi:hypothetical protein
MLFLTISPFNPHSPHDAQKRSAAYLRLREATTTGTPLRGRMVGDPPPLQRRFSAVICRMSAWVPAELAVYRSSGAADLIGKTNRHANFVDAISAPMSRFSYLRGQETMEWE